MSVGEFKANFSQALKKVLAGEEIGISYGKNKDILARPACLTQNQVFPYRIMSPITLTLPIITIARQTFRKT